MPERNAGPWMTAVRVAASYAVAGAVWVLLSDRVLALLVEDPERLTWLQTAKGWAYILLTAALVLWLVHRSLVGLLRSEQSLRERGEQLHDLLEFSVDGIVLVDGEGGIVQANPAAALMLGRPADQLLSLRLEDLVPDGEVRATLAPAALATGTGRTGELTAPQPDGTTRTLEYSAQFFPPNLSALFLRDTTALRTSESNLRMILDSSLQTYVLIGSDRNIRAFNRIAAANCRAIVGKELRAGTPLTDYVRESVREEYEALFERALRGEPVALSRLIPDAAGEEEAFELHFDPAYSTDGRIVGVSFGAVNVTRRVRAEHALRESEEKFRRLVEATVDWVWQANARFQLTYASPQVRSLLGYDPGDLTGQVLFALLEPGEAARTEPEFAEAAVARARVMASEKAFLHRDGHTVLLEINAAPVFDESGGFMGYVGTCRDTTERRRAEEHRRELDLQLQQAQKLESLGILAGGVAHDFNNLLVGVLGNADLILEELPADSPVRPLVEEISVSASHAAALTRQMLAYSGRHRLDVRPLDLSATVREVAPLLEASVTKKVRVDYRLGEGLPPVTADATQLRQVVMNLVLNASEALGDRTGTVTVSTSLTWCEPGDPHLYVPGPPRSGAHVRLEVTDTGSGMTPEVQARMFDPFYTTKLAGRGLGLATVLGIVRGHGGVVEVDSGPGRGTRFAVLLPAVDTVPPGEASSRAEAAPWTGQGTILLVDDEETVRSVGRRMLESLGFTVILACDGSEALELVTRYGHRFAGVLLDLTMAEMDGVETLERLRGIDPTIPVVMSSGYDDQGTLERLADLGVTGFIRKPYLLNDLRATLRRALRNV